MIHARLMFFFTKNITIHKHQFGFQKGNLDFAKAFDSVNHEILLTRLEYYSVRRIAHQLIKYYLSEPLQCVKIR